MIVTNTLAYSAVASLLMKFFIGFAEKRFKIVVCHRNMKNAITKWGIKMVPTHFVNFIFSLPPFDQICPTWGQF
jgi:hypothetical protein